MKSIRKTYRGINSDLLYAEVKDFAVKHGAKVGESRMETYTLPNESAAFVSRGTVTFITGDGSKPEKQCIRAHVVGSSLTETKLMLDIDEKLFPQNSIDALQADLDFIFGSHEALEEDEEEE